MKQIIFATYLVLAGLASAQNGSSNACNVTTQYLADPPYDNYFYSDCNVDAQV